MLQHISPLPASLPTLNLPSARFCQLELVVIVHAEGTDSFLSPLPWAPRSQLWSSTWPEMQEEGPLPRVWTVVLEHWHSVFPKSSKTWFWCYLIDLVSDWLDSTPSSWFNVFGFFIRERAGQHTQVRLLVVPRHPPLRFCSGKLRNPLAWVTSFCRGLYVGGQMPPVVLRDVKEISKTLRVQQFLYFSWGISTASSPSILSVYIPQ